MRQTFVIPGRFMSFNKYLDLHWTDQNATKQEYDRLVWAYAKQARIKPPRTAVKIHILWVEKNRKRDLDNIFFGVKFIQDGLVKAQVLHNDTYREVKGISHEIAFDSQNPRIEVTIEEV